MRTHACLFGTVAIAIFLLSPLALGHTGGNGGLSSTGRLEGEGYDAPDADCDPDYDNEHTQTHTPSWAASGGAVAFLPHSSCGLTFQGVTTGSGRFERFHVAASGIAGDQIGITVQVRVDGVLAASGDSFHAFDGSQNDHYLSFSFTSPVSAGTHTIRIDYVVYQGCSCSNMYIDYVEGTFGAPPPPPPPPPGGGSGGCDVDVGGRALDLRGAVFRAFDILPGDLVCVNGRIFDMLSIA